MTAAAPPLSVLLPCRNAAVELVAAIESIQAQSFPDFEVLAVDDGSTDGTAELLRDWARRDERVRVLATGGTGLVAALQLAAQHARGTVFARMDADDICEPRRFERQLGFLAENSRLGACGTGIHYFPRQQLRDGSLRYETWLNGLSGAARLQRDLFVECPIAHPTLMVRADAFRRAGGYRDPGWPEDYDLVLRLWLAGFAMDNVPEVLLHWRDAPARTSRTDPRYSPDAFRRCKVHYLRESLLVGRQGAVIWGAGPVGKALALELLRQDVAVRAFVDLDPRKIGQTVHGSPVIPPDGIQRFRGALALAAVGSPGAREEIRGALDAHGWREMVDYVAVA